MLKQLEEYSFLFKVSLNTVNLANFKHDALMHPHVVVALVFMCLKRSTKINKYKHPYF